MSRPSLYLTFLQRNLGEGMSWVEASDRALAGVAHAYDLVKQAVLGPPALSSASDDSPSAGTFSNSYDEEVVEAETDEDDDAQNFAIDETDDVIDAETVEDGVAHPGY